MEFSRFGRGQSPLRDVRIAAGIRLHMKRDGTAKVPPQLRNTLSRMDIQISNFIKETGFIYMK